MEHDHRFPIIATTPDGTVRKPLHLVVGPGLTMNGDTTDGAPTKSILWAWSPAVGDAFPLLITEAAPEPVPGRSDRWKLTTDQGVWQLRYSRSASCCGDPMKRWRPPGVGASRRSATA
jgi:hypothetical protein